jgi:hypothetical protein
MPKEALVSSTTQIRQVPETWKPYRLVEAEDLVPGREDIIMIDLTHFRPELSEALWKTTRVRLDDPAVRPTALRGLSVFYHCVEPAWKGQCIVPLEEFTGYWYFGPRDCTRYWIKYDPAAVR